MCGFSEQLPGGCTLARCTLRQSAPAGDCQWPLDVGSRAAPRGSGRQAGAASVGRSVTWIPSGFDSFLPRNLDLCGDIRGHGDSNLLSGSCSVPRLSSTFSAQMSFGLRRVALRLRLRMI